ncbi:D-alanyl-D-alanine carboxypeptidase [bacterium]|nr:D-alanyl-D-alanine carboxypeptidase [bacterium]
MSKNIKFFLIVFLLSLPFWWGVNVLQENLENYFYSIQIEKNPPSLFTAKIYQNYISKIKEREEKKTGNFQIEAESVISVEIDKQGRERVLFSRAENQKMPIASISKLMTAIVALEFYQPSLRIQISKTAVGQAEENGNLKVGEILRVKDLLYIMLIESSNDAAFALSEIIGPEGFRDLMNLKAKDIGLENTWFFNPTGLDPTETAQPINYSTAKDLVKLTKYLLTKHPEILDILSKKEYPLYLENGVFHHTLENTNKLLREIPEIIAGKTGYTERAGGCLLEILKGKKPGSYLINVILNSPDKFGEMRKLIKFIY